MKQLVTFAVVIISLLLHAAYAPPRAAAQTRERGMKVGAQPAEVSGGRDIQRWAVVIGVSRYKNGEKNVNGVTVSNLVNAADDAQRFYDFLRSPEGGEFRDVKDGGRMTLLKDEQATKANVKQAFDTLKQAKPEDYFIIYIAAHGANIPTPDPKTRVTIEIPQFVMHDFDAGDVGNTAIRMTDFRELVEQIPARKGLVISDTCHSAGVMLAGRGMFATTGANTRFIQAMNKVPPGVGFLSAAGQLEAAQESNEYGGIFTYCLLEALRGNADVTPADGIVTFGEADAYLKKAVPELTERLSGLRQTPTSNTTTLEANRIPLALVSYPPTGACSDPQRCGTLVIRTPDVDGIEVTINGTSLGAFNRRQERTLRLPIGKQSINFVRGAQRATESPNIEASKSTVVEVNLSFSQTKDVLVDAPSRYAGVFIGDDKQPTAQAKKYFEDGVEEFNKQRHAEAIKLFDRAVQANGGAFANALIYRGRAQQSLRQHRAAVESFAAALKQRPSDFEAQTLLAEAKFNAGANLQEVVADLRDVINRHPHFDFARVVYGNVLLLQWGLSPERGQLLKDAEQQLRNAISVNPKSPPAYLVLADVLLHSSSENKRKEAVEMAKKALELFTELAEKKVRFSHGLKSLSLFHVVLNSARYENNAVLAEANYILGQALTRVANGEAASDCQASTLSIGEQGNYLKRARPYLAKAEQLARAAKDQRRLGLIYYISAENYLLQGDLEAAIKDAERAVATPEMNDYHETHLLLYEAYKGNQQFACAAQEMQIYRDLVSKRANQEELARLGADIGQMKSVAAANQQKCTVGKK